MIRSSTPAPDGTRRPDRANLTGPSANYPLTETTHG